MTEKLIETNETFRLDVSTLLNLPVPRECIAGIQANCELLRLHARMVEAFPIPGDGSEADDA